MENPPAAPALEPLAESVLAVIATWRDQGAPTDPTTASIARRLGIRANTEERADVNDALTHLKARGFVKFEVEADGLNHWRPTAQGEAHARRSVAA